MFLPPYSPDLNPIEHYWAWLKKKIRGTVYRFETLDEVISNAMGKSIGYSRSMCALWIQR